MSRPSKYKQSLVEEILLRYSDGESLTKICKDKHMPKRNTIYRWRSQYPEFRDAYLLALEQHVDALIDEAGEIVDSESDPQRARVRVDYRKWLASRLNRDKYGDKLDVRHNVIIDITPALLEATKRMKEVKDVSGEVVTSKNELVEGENSDTNTM